MDELKFEEMRTTWRKHLQGMTGGQDTTSVELVNLIRMIDNIFDSSVNQHPELKEISGPRLGILLRLMAEEEFGNHQGLNPTRLSHYQNVKKNTISSLLSGLEDQGLIERAIDPQDKRAFNIRITAAGRDLIKSTMPLRIQHVNQMTEGLTLEDKKQLLTLLDKLRQSMLKANHHLCKERTLNSD